MIGVDDFQRLLLALEELREKAKEGWIIVVEGIRDVQALRDLKVEGEIIIFSGFSDTCDKIRNRKAIILTDSDKKGLEIEKGLVKALSSWGNVPDTTIKRKIFSATRKEVLRVEELFDFVERHKNNLKF